METINLGRVAFVYKGDYSALTTYNKMDVVFDGESSFVSQIDNNVGNELVNGLNWKYLSRGNNLELQEAKQDIAALETDLNITSGKRIDYLFKNGYRSGSSWVNSEVSKTIDALNLIEGDKIIIKNVTAFSSYVLKSWDSSYNTLTIVNSANLISINGYYYYNIPFVENAVFWTITLLQADTNSQVSVERFIDKNGLQEINNSINSTDSKVNSLSLNLSNLITIYPTTKFLYPSQFTNSGYWGHDSITYVAKLLTGNYKSTVLIPVTPGQVVRWHKWAKNISPVGEGVIALGAYTNDSTAYLGTVSRINYRDLTTKDYTNGEFTWVVPSNVGLIGISAQVTTYVPDAGAYIEITEADTFAFTDEAKEKINEAVAGQQTSEADRTAELFLKGNATKTYNNTKKLGIIAAGQSNIEGRNPLSELPAEVVFPMTNCHYISKSKLGIFKAFESSDLALIGENRCWAFDTIVYNQIATIDNQELYVIKWAVGGTSIDPEGATDSHWSPFYEFLATGDTALLKDFEESIRKAVELQGSNFEIRAFLWHQGEGDSVTDATASRYYDNLKYMLSYIRGVVGNPRLPFICGNFSNNRTTPIKQAIFDAYTQLDAEDPYFYCVDMRLANLLDAYHFNSAASQYFGKCAYNYLVDAGVLTTQKIPVGTITGI